MQRYRESLIVLAGVAIGFALYFGFRTPDQTQSHRQVYRTVAATAEKGSGTTAPLFAGEVSRRDRAHRIGRKRIRANRGARVTAEDVARAITVANPPEAIADPPKAIDSPEAAAKTRPPQQNFDDSG